MIEFFVIGAMIKDFFCSGWKDMTRREDAAAHPNSWGTYYDSKGRLRDIKTNEERMHISRDGKQYLTDLNLNIKRDLTEEFNNGIIETEKNKGVNRLHTTAHLPQNPYRNPSDPWKKYVWGWFYVDLQNEKEYVSREFCCYKKDGVNIPEIRNDERFKNFWCEFYMDIKTGYLVRVTDKHKQFYEREKKKAEVLGEPIKEINYELAKEFIETFNKWQDKRKRFLDLNNYFDYNEYYCNHGNPMNV